MKKIAVILIVIAMLIAVGIAGFSISILELRASNTLLRKIALVKPGIKLSAVQDDLGPIMREETGVGDVMNWGSVQDPTFCQGKKLFWFYASTPPCRALEVYTDTNNIVVYVTWHGL